MIVIIAINDICIVIVGLVREKKMKMEVRKHTPHDKYMYICKI